MGNKYCFFLSLSLCLILSVSLSATEYHVSASGSDTNDGSLSNPFKTISFAADQVRPGDVVIVHEGIYRELVTPITGGSSTLDRIVFRAADEEKVIIKGSEIINDWKNVEKGIWKVRIPNSFFGDYNPYKVIIEGDWFNDHGRIHHTGEVFLNDESMFESPSLEGVRNPKPMKRAANSEASIYTWYCESNEEFTIIYANFHEYNPNEELVEINVRKSCFYPDYPGVNYITVSGFHMSQAATQWAPPTAEQIGLIGTHWSKGWIIEDNVISHSKCSAITLGKDRATGQNVWLNNKKKDGATHYNEVIFRALQAGWSKEKIGSHIVRNNTIYNCEQGGVIGSLGAVYSQITDNHIYNIWTKRMFSGAEIAGIKIHASIDVLIKNNYIHNNGDKGVWLDWMAQGTRVTGNIFHENGIDLFSEVNHGPYLIDNNLFLSEKSLRDWSEGGAYVHNLIAGMIEVRLISDRFTPYHFQHSTEVAGLRNIYGGDNRFINNIIVKGYDKMPEKVRQGIPKKIAYGLDAYTITKLPSLFDGNIYLNGAQPYSDKERCIEDKELDTKISMEAKPEGVYINLQLKDDFSRLNNSLVNTEMLGFTIISELGFEHSDGSPLELDTDFFGKQRNPANPTSGPFEELGDGRLELKVW